MAVTVDTDFTHVHHLQLDQHEDATRRFRYLKETPGDSDIEPRDFTGWSAVLIVKDPESIEGTLTQPLNEVFRIDSASGDIVLDADGFVTCEFGRAVTALLEKQVDKQALFEGDRGGFPGYEYELWLISPTDRREQKQKGLINSDRTNGPV